MLIFGLYNMENVSLEEKNMHNINVYWRHEVELHDSW